MLIHSTVVCVFKVNSTHSMKYRIMVGGQLQRWGSLHDMQWDDYLKITVSCSDNSCSIETTMVVVIIHNRDNNFIDLSTSISAVINDMNHGGFVFDEPHATYYRRLLIIIGGRYSCSSPSGSCRTNNSVVVRTRTYSSRIIPRVSNNEFLQRD